MLARTSLTGAQTCPSSLQSSQIKHHRSHFLQDSRCTSAWGFCPCRRASKFNFISLQGARVLQACACIWTADAASSAVADGQLMQPVLCRHGCAVEVIRAQLYSLQIALLSNMVW